MNNEQALLNLKPFFSSMIDRINFLIVKTASEQYVVGKVVYQPDGTQRVGDAERFDHINDAWKHWVGLMKEELELFDDSAPMIRKQR